MIKSGFKLNNTWEYPSLGISYSDGITTIILFEEERKGTIVFSTKDDCLGYHNNEWIMENFEPFFGEVTIY